MNVIGSDVILTTTQPSLSGQGCAAAQVYMILLLLGAQLSLCVFYTVAWMVKDPSLVGCPLDFRTGAYFDMPVVQMLFCEGS